MGAGATFMLLTPTLYRILEFDSSSNVWGSYGTGNGQFIYPKGIAVGTSPPGDVYVVDTGNNRIQKFTPTGNYIGQWGSYGSENGQFNFTPAVAMNLNNPTSSIPSPEPSALLTTTPVPAPTTLAKMCDDY